MAVVYWIHLEQPLGNLENPRGQAQHYLGDSQDLDARLAAHRGGHGARLLAAANAQGIAWRVVRTWPGGDRGLERALKRRHRHRGLCPVCRGEV